MKTRTELLAEIDQLKFQLQTKETETFHLKNRITILSNQNDLLEHIACLKESECEDLYGELNEVLEYAEYNEINEIVNILTD